MKFLLHACCAPCAIYVIQELKSRGFDVTAFFYNPNIHPKQEYKKRINEMKKYCQQNEIEFIEGEYELDKWYNLIKGFEKEAEGGRRCEICYQMRLEQTADLAARKNYDYFGTTLSISPHKKSLVINKIGNQLADKYKIKFYPADWKKRDGFKSACELSRQQGFYRQNYCGCAFSLEH